MKSANTPLTSPEMDELIATYLAQGLEPKDSVVLENWLEASPENRKHFRQVREIWFSTTSANEKKRYNEEEAYNRFRNRTRQVPSVKKAPRTYFLYRYMFRIAVVVLLCIISFVSYWGGKEQVKKQFAGMMVETEAPLGSRTKFSLPDGTLVWLNGGSKISYSQGFGVVERKLQLIGEGYFEVTKNEQLPFEISTKELELQVLGTKFNFKNYPEDEEVAVDLLEGRVSLKNALRNKEVWYLEPNQKAMLNKQNGELHISRVKAQHASEWTKGFLFFDEDLLPDIAKELERSYNVKISWEDKSLDTCRFYGNFERKEQTVQEILEMLASTGKLQYRINGKNIHLYMLR